MMFNGLRASCALLEPTRKHLSQSILSLSKGGWHLRKAAPFDELRMLTSGFSDRPLLGRQILKQQPDGSHERQGQRELLEQLLVDVAQYGFPCQCASHCKGYQP